MNKIIYVVVATALIGGFIYIATQQKTSTPVGTTVIPKDSMTQDQNLAAPQSSDTSSTPEDGVIKMNSGGFFFAPNTLQAKVGEEVNIDITSTGLHTFTIDELGVDVPTQDGITTRVTFTPNKAGTYTYYCAIPGHKEAGQIGTLTVTQ